MVRIAKMGGSASSAAMLTAARMQEEELPLLAAVAAKRAEATRRYTDAELDAMEREESDLCAELTDTERWQKLEKRLERYGAILEHPEHPDYPQGDELAARTAEYERLQAEYRERVAVKIPRQENLRMALIGAGRTRAEWTCKCGGIVPDAGGTMCAYCWNQHRTEVSDP